MLRLLAAIGLVTAALPASGDELAFVLLAGSGQHVTGQIVRVEIAALNPSGHEIPFVIESSLEGMLTQNDRTLPVVLKSIEPVPVSVPPGGFAVRRYEFQLPANITGQAILTVSRTGSSGLQAVLTMTREGEVTTAVKNPPVIPPVQAALAEMPASSALGRNFAGRFLPNQPVYFIYGDAAQAAKFQFSFDYRLATLSDGSATRTAVDSLKFGYTQRSVWNLDGQSSPFYDTSYMPEFAFSRDERMPKERSRIFTWLGWRAALQHESNGKEGNASRSVNTIYLRPRMVLGALGEWAFVVLPEFQFYLGESGENPDIEDYRGYGKLRFYFGHNNGPTLMFTGWTGKDLDHPTYQLDLAVPVRLRWLNLESYLYVQYFNGYGESLLAYDKRSNAFRAGVALVR